jgi:hypothetical protein
MKETYEDNKLAAGKYKFIITEVGDRVPTQNSHYRTWKFKTLVDGGTKEIWQNLFPFTALPMLAALGYEKKDGRIEWDTDDVIGKEVQATLFYEKDKNDPGKEYPRLGEWREIEQSEQIPF